MTEWKRVKIGEVCHIEKGATGIASATPGDYPLVVTALERKTCTTYQFDCEAVCIPLVSSSGHGKKSLKYVHYQNGKFALGTILAAVIPNNKNELSARYLHQYLQFYKDTLIVPLMHGAANVSLAIRDIEQIEIPLPPIEKQNEFAKLFVRMQENDVEHQREFETQKDLIKKLRQSILQDAIEGKLTEDWRKENLNGGSLPLAPAGKPSSATPSAGVFATSPQGRSFERTPATPPKSRGDKKMLAPITDEEKPFEIPESWKWVRLGEIGESNIGITYHPENVNDIGIPVYRSNNIVDSKINNSDLIRIDLKPRDNQFLNIGDILLCARNGSQKLVGKCAYIKSLPELCSFGAFMSKYTSKYNNYIFFILQSSFFRNYMDNCSSTKIYQLTQKMLLDFAIPLPPLAEQNEIVQQVENQLAKVEQLEQQVQERENLTKSLFRGILKNAFEGE